MTGFVICNMLYWFCSWKFISVLFLEIHRKINAKAKGFSFIFAYELARVVTYIESERGFHGAELVYLSLHETGSVASHGWHRLRLPV